MRLNESIGLRNESIGLSIGVRNASIGVRIEEYWSEK